MRTAERAAEMAPRHSEISEDINRRRHANVRAGRSRGRVGRRQTINSRCQSGSGNIAENRR
eukprot:3129894-Pyramimonas_sp.AAC.1